MTQREEFEKWFNEYNDKGFMDSKDMEFMFEAWQASRENLPKIKLPGVNFSSTFYVDIENRVINKCKQAIHEAGYEVE